MLPHVGPQVRYRTYDGGLTALRWITAVNLSAVQQHWTVRCMSTYMIIAEAGHARA
jgi:hypothetical protein